MLMGNCRSGIVGKCVRGLQCSIGRLSLQERNSLSRLPFACDRLPDAVLANKVSGGLRMLQELSKRKLCNESSG